MSQNNMIMFCFSIVTVQATDIIVLLGTTVNVSCPATHSVEWKFRAVGMRLPGFVYFNNEITRTYKAGGRHDVKFNSDTGSSELVITNVMTSDAGTYTRTEEVGSSRVNTFFELTILCESSRVSVAGQNVTGQNVRDKMSRTKRYGDKMSLDVTKCRGKNSVDNMLGTKCRGENVLDGRSWTINYVVDKMAWSKCRDQNVLAKM